MIQVTIWNMGRITGIEKFETETYAFMWIHRIFDSAYRRKDKEVSFSCAKGRTNIFVHNSRRKV